MTSLTPGRVKYSSAVAALNKCRIVEAGPSPAITITPPELAAEYAKDPEAFKNKYDGKSLIIGGQVVNKTSDDGSPSLVFEGKGTMRISCFLGVSLQDREIADAIKVGQKVKLVGVFSGYLSPDKKDLQVTKPFHAYYRGQAVETGRTDRLGMRMDAPPHERDYLDDDLNMSPGHFLRAAKKGGVAPAETGE